MVKILFVLLLALTPLFNCAQNNFDEIFSNNKRPFKENIRIDISDALGNQSHLPVTILKGKKNGPVFTIVAGVHGYEYPPIAATQELMQEIKTENLSGTIIFVPIANTASFFSRTPFINPLDKINLNVAFPGDSTGSITQKLAHFITKKIIPVSDVFLDVHGGDANEDLIPFVCYYNNKNKPEQTQKAKELSETSGFEYVVSYPYTLTAEEPAKYAFKQAVQDGKTALSIESGKLGNVQKDAVKLIKMGVCNMLGYMKMYDNRMIGNNPNLVKFNNQAYIKSKEKGIFYSSLKAGSAVKEGELLGYVTDEFGQMIKEYKAPESGVILYKIGTPPVNVGETLMCIGIID